MELVEKLKELSQRIIDLKGNVLTEEATKHSFIMPFISALGYDIFNPTVVIPEFTADISKKKNEKVDYAIMYNNQPLILIEAKSHTENLDIHATQLERYFTVTECRFAILTNGIEYRFFTDLEKPNKMDTTPFFTFNILNIKDRDLKELEKFISSNLDIDKILASAENKKYVSAIKNIFKEEVKNPNEDFVRLFASRLTDKPLRQNIIDEFKAYVKTAFSEIVTDMAQDKINSLKSKLTVEIDGSNEETEKTEEDNGIITTEEEIQGFFIVKSILAEKIDLDRIAARDTKSYFGILLDDNNRKWIARLYFNTKQKYLSLHIEDKQEEKYPIEKLQDIYNFKDKLINVIDRLEA
ncbi:type I restriction endonuclease [Aliarcobacter butzleri]|uniref:type I restriction endonuclease n=1 Tax=Aliarcobacter butzleri TaxID=28197 RepID=UPI00062E5196|nr:type I restriction endonuclease [Aliarcobacter butzleri]KLD98771.1 restriction endonuclease or methylase [Aliarcobacter butzleri L349]MCG3690115.1 type I restriction enzyme HsdR N-terminal domain-containing protein [Aliarcobacter butzleri]